MKRLIYVSLGLLGGIACVLPLKNYRAISKETYLKADSLNRLAYELRYKDLSASAKLATQAYPLASDNPELAYTSLNLMGFAAFMHMDFEHAIRLYQRVLMHSSDEIECLIANVGMMKVCQRTSMNKEFYDYRNRALQHINRIKEDESLIKGKEERRRMNYAFSEFYIVSAIYFYYLQQQHEALEAIDAVTPRMIRKDKAQQVYYQYMKGSGGLYVADSYENLVIGELEYLIKCLETSRTEGYVYFEANAMQAIAELLHFKRNRNLLWEKKRGLLQLLNETDLPLDSLPLDYAQKALKLFKRYGDWYQISGTYRTMATCYNGLNEPEKALSCLNSALQYVNWHHEKFYHCADTLDRLLPYKPYPYHAVELDWIENEGIKTVPEWILRLREQLSRTYAAMGRKAESDYNRNIYLDLLDYIRQDKSLESRYETLAAESRQLNALLVLVILGIGLLFIFVWSMNRYWKKQNQVYLDKLNQVFELCKKITSSVPSNPESKEEIVSRLEVLIRPDFQLVFGMENLRLSLVEGFGEKEGKSSLSTGITSSDGMHYACQLQLPGSHEGIGCLEYTLCSPMPKDKKELLKLTLPYLAWALKNSMNMLWLDDEKRQIEKTQYVHEQHLIENKRQNLAKKACFSIVTGMLPYIDRIVHEIHQLNTKFSSMKATLQTEKIHYTHELLDQINEYNDILSMWIKMRQGALSLHTETFALQELFDMIQKSHRTFEMKGLKLIVSPTPVWVKADKALTLFMINTLAENARKYTPEGGEVRLYATESTDFVEVSVSDTGVGLSAEDITHLLNEKVYDASAIGLSTATNREKLKKQKGHGFGLMNCKGIIEKYRKTNTLFSVCCFGIESEVGKGSRFYFRLPKGVKRGLSVLLLLWGLLCGTSCSFTEQPSVASAHFSCDTMLTEANQYANLVYECNVRGEYRQALEFADSVFHYMNLHVQAISADSLPSLNRYDTNFEIPEVKWLNLNIPTDYYILLDVRNEVAVAGLALQDFKVYYYNNRAYTALYKLISKDRSLDLYCNQMLQSSRNKQIALALLILLVVISIWGYYLFSVRPRLKCRYNMEQVFIANESVSSLILEYNTSDSQFISLLHQKLQHEIRELVPRSNLLLALYDESAGQLTFQGDEQRISDWAYKIRQVYQHPEYPCTQHKHWLFFPLCAKWTEEPKIGLGVLAIEFPYADIKEEDKLLLGLIAGELSIMLYQNVIQVKRKHHDIESTQDDTSRLIYEENLLHVQNLVLDNCLSTLKHETIYYPNRIKYLMDKMVHPADMTVDEKQALLEQTEELVGYYRSIFTLLSSCAARQLDGVTFRRTEIDINELMKEGDKYLKKCLRKSAVDLRMEIYGGEKLKATGDYTLLVLLLETLLNEALQYHEPGVLRLKAREKEGFVEMDFTDTRRHLPQEELNHLFYPRLSAIQLEEGGKGLRGTEFLICKQIIREHDDYAGRRGCRIVALSAEEGFTIRFTVPLKRL